MTKSTDDKPRGFVFYTQDYFGDIAVRLMPGELRIFWVEAFLLMDQSPTRGLLLKKNGEKYRLDELATTMNLTTDVIERAIAWIKKEEIASLDRKTGVLMCRRMFREAKRREINTKNGKKGGNPTLVKRSSQTDLFDSVNPIDNPPVKPRARVPEPEPEPEPDINSSLSHTVPLIPNCSTSEDSSSSANIENASSTVDLAPRKNRVARKRDEAFDFFAAAHQEKTGAGYVKKSGDFPQLAILREANDVPPLAMPERWQEAVENFFASPMSSYSFADLCARYPIFRNSALDGYRNPINHQNRRNGNGQQPRETRADRTRNAASSVLSRMRVPDGGGGERGAERSNDSDLSRKARTVK